MSIWTTLFTGASGLEAHGDALSVVGDNIANVSTIGYREARAGFDEVIAGTGENGQNLGAGVRMAGPETMYTQGTLSSTGNALDLAVRGDGFFALAGSHDGQKGTFYTRDGRFHLDDKGSIVSPDGMRLQGYLIDPSSKTAATTATDLTIGGQSPPQPTSSVVMGLNLESGAAVVQAPFDPKNPGPTSSYSTTTQVYDSLGNAHTVQMFFRNGGNGTWDYHAMVDGSEVNGGQKGVLSEIASGTMTFTATGALNSVAPNAANASFVGATANQAINFNFGDPIAAGGTGLKGSTQFAGKSSVNLTSQDGWAAGALTGVSVSDQGVITGRFSNGQTRDVAQVALATVPSDTGLQRVGNQLFTVTNKSGEALLNAAGGKGGSISSGALEGSNVDLGNELVTLIAYQRAFQANSQTVNAASQMLTEVTQLGR